MEALVQILILSMAVTCCTGSSFEAASGNSSDPLAAEITINIAGGKKVSHGEIPYLLAIFGKRGYEYVYNCGASIISDRWALTAAHCVYGRSPKDILLLAGAHGFESPVGTEEFVKVSKIVLHGGFNNGAYNDTKYYHDIALLKFSQQISFNEHIERISLPKPNRQFKGTVVVSGRGTEVFGGPPTSEPMTVEVDINEWEYCTKFYPYMSSSQFCTGKVSGGKGQCSGDSGGPVVKMSPRGTNPVLVGIVSAAIGCGHYPNLHINVSSYRRWIEKKMLFQ